MKTPIAVCVASAWMVICALVADDQPSRRVLTPAAPESATGAGDSVNPVLSRDGRWLVFVSRADNLVTNDANGGTRDVFARDLANGAVHLVSVNRHGTSGNGPSLDPVVSADGRWVAFVSRASDLSPDDTNDVADVFVRDLQEGTTRLVTRGVGGGSANGESAFPVMTPDGRYLGYESLAANLVSGDTNRVWDVFVDDLATGHRLWLSAPSAEPDIARLAAGPSRDLVIADNGGVALFRSESLNLAPPIHRDGRVHVNRIHLHGPLAPGGTNRMLDVFPVGLPGPVVADAWAVRLSGDGRQLALRLRQHAGSGLVEGVVVVNLDTGGWRMVESHSAVLGHLRDLRLTGPMLSDDGATLIYETRTPLNPGGPFVSAVVADRTDGQGDATLLFTTSVTPPPEVRERTFRLLGTSADGAAVAVLGRHDEDPVGAAEWLQILVLRRATGEVRRISRAMDGGSLRDLEPVDVAFSGDGRRVAFATRDSRLMADDRNGAYDIWVYDWDSNQLGLASHRHPTARSLTGPGRGLVGRHSVSADGRRVVLTSHAPVASMSDTNESSDVLMGEFDDGVLGGNLRPVSVMAAGTALGNARSLEPVISSDGRWVAFVSAASDLVANDGNGSTDIFLRDISSASTVLVSRRPDGSSPVGWGSWAPAISPDGRWVAFISRSAGMAEGASSTVSHLYLFDRQTTSVSWVTRAASGSSSVGEGDSEAPEFSPTGDWLAFESRASNLVPDTPGLGRWVYARHVKTGELRLLSPRDSTLRQPMPRPDPVGFSPDGGFVVFSQIRGTGPSLFLHEFEANATTLVAVNASAGVLSRHATRVAYRQEPEQPGGSTQIRVWERATNADRVVSVDVDGQPGNADSKRAFLSSDGRRLVFTSQASGLVTNFSVGARGDTGVFERDLDAGITTVLVPPATGGEMASPLILGMLAANDRTLVLNRYANDVSALDYNQETDVYVLWLPDPESELRVTRIVRLSTGEVTLTWVAANQRSYRVQGKETLQDAWIDLPLTVNQQGGLHWATDPDAVGRNQRFYRVTAGPLTPALSEPRR